MSIHEVVYDTWGRITQATCVDEKIKLAIKKPEDVTVRYKRSPVVIEINRPPELSDIDILGDNVLPARVRIITAETPDTVSDKTTILGYDSKGKLTDVVLSDNTYSKDEINQSPIITESHRGFFWTEPGQKVDVHLSSRKPTGLFSRAKALLGI
ncbi:MAG: hypothetical protein M1277_00660 [Patescibacteria group bacterium]|nr:hypothetical protein [Patescibacteria group bacterium]